MHTTPIATSSTATPSTATAPSAEGSTADELLALGWEVNAHSYRVVHLAARFDEEGEWFRSGVKSAAQWIATQLDMETATAREWIRVGYELRWLPAIDAAFAAQKISYAKARILTRWANAGNEERLLELARGRPANRLTVAIAREIAADGSETDEERDRRLHESRGLTTWTDGDGMTVIRVVLPASVAKPVVAAVDSVVKRIAALPADDVPDQADGSGSDTAVESADDADLSADRFGGRKVTIEVAETAQCDRKLSADRSASHTEQQQRVADRCSLRTTVRAFRQRWQPAPGDDWLFPSMAQQRADAFMALFIGLGIDLTTEVVIHVRGDGVTFDDGTPTTERAVTRLLDTAFIRLLIHDTEGRPINASARRRHPTTRQKRVVMETHRHECVDCHSTDLLELDHNPPFHQTKRTVTHELEPRCAPCHRARHGIGRQHEQRHDLSSAA